MMRWVKDDMMLCVSTERHCGAVTSQQTNLLSETLANCGHSFSITGPQAACFVRWWAAATANCRAPQGVHHPTRKRIQSGSGCRKFCGNVRRSGWTAWWWLPSARRARGSGRGAPAAPAPARPTACAPRNHAATCSSAFIADLQALVVGLPKTRLCKRAVNCVLKWFRFPLVPTGTRSLLSRTRCCPPACPRSSVPTWA